MLKIIPYKEKSNVCIGQKEAYWVATKSPDITPFFFLWSYVKLISTQYNRKCLREMQLNTINRTQKYFEEKKSNGNFSVLAH